MQKLFLKIYYQEPNTKNPQNPQPNAYQVFRQKLIYMLANKIDFINHIYDHQQSNTIKRTAKKETFLYRDVGEDSTKIFVINFSRKNNYKNQSNMSQNKQQKKKSFVSAENNNKIE